ncbi:hypothetical protein B4U80_01867 [Leptotrombidium deliense]|uniref:ZP domain-containing protein n=1 Tax=Leptotrombidium deliense TaxID=299467 RepID=A0A443SUS0_9ACAR|nr:hypothetical protein B4U80_01867 [Leptotrombidium deliense]
MHASFVRENLEVDDEWDYHQKLCLPVDNCTRHWIFEKITSFQLFAMDEKTLNEVFTEEQCMDACIVEKRFVCRSARYDSTNKKCVLSKYDRRTAAESFKRINNNQIHYFENQCIQDPTKCSFRRLKFARQLNSSHVYILNEKRKRDECERICLNNTDFNCRSYTYDSDTKLCALSPQDSLTIEDTGAISSNRKRSLKQIDSTTIETYEKATCIAVDIRCEANSMTAMITTSGPFRGRLFTLTHPHECYNVGNEQDNLIALSIPLHGRQCGTMNVGNGTFQNSLVIQHHPLILRDSDRRVDVACDYHRIKRKLRGGKQVTESDTVAMTQVITGLVPTPAVSLRVVNSTGAEVRGVELGENLQLKVDMLDQSIFGIFGSDLIARSGEGTESVALIDDRGCPIESAVFPALTRVGRDSKSLTAPFQAFRFTSDAAVKFQMTVSFCLDACEPVNCNDPMIKANKSIDSFGRRRRRRDLTADKYYGSGNTSDDTVTVTSIDELQSGDILRDVTMETTVYVMNNLKPLSYADKRNKLLRKHFSEDSNEHSENSSSTFDCDTANIQFELQSGVLFALQAYKTTRDFQPQECLKVCRQEDACKSLNIDYKKNVCQFLSTSFVDNRMRKENPHFNHFRKICLRTQSACSRHWAFERVRGRELVSVPYGKIHVDAHTLEHCQAACLDFKPFVCRSAEFNYQNSQCKLSPYNRFSSGDKHAKLGVRSYIDYMENNCAHEAKGFCNVKSTKQSRLVLADRFLFTDDVQNCEEECMHNKHFICRSFTYESTTKTCALSHHSKRSYSNGAVIRSATHTFYEVSTCFEGKQSIIHFQLFSINLQHFLHVSSNRLQINESMTVDCESDMMNAVIHSNTLFQGKVYTRDRPQSCFVDVGNAMQFSLPIQLSGDECGTITEEEGKFSNVLVIQSNDHVVTAFDKAIGVKCGYDVGNKTGETALHIK